MKEVKRDIKKVRLGILLNRTIIILKFLVIVVTLELSKTLLILFNFNSDLIIYLRNTCKQCVCVYTR